MIDKLTGKQRETLDRIFSEYDERAALHAWVRRCFSTGAKIAFTVGALVTAISGLSAGFSWLLGHWH